MPSTANSWLLFALCSAFFAALTAIFGKIGVSAINSNLANFIRTVVILLLIVGIVSWRQGWVSLKSISPQNMGMLVACGIATGLSWICYYRALQLAPASQVAPVDKLSVAFVILMAAIFLGETLTWKTVLGGVLVTIGAIVIAL